MRLQDRHALITGGSAGIGLATAQCFIEAGATVTILGRDGDRLAAAVSALGPRASALPADVSRPDDLAEALWRLRERTTGIDILFANAGASEAADFPDGSETDFDALFAVNVKGACFTVSYALPHMRNGGSIILTGSVAARKGRPGDPLYAASKGAVSSFARALALQEDILARRIRVNVVTPGATRTPLTRAAQDDAAADSHVRSMVPMGRWGEARDVAEAVLFLASDAASYVTGTEIVVDGGLSAA